jgi:hypothetical protein
MRFPVRRTGTDVRARANLLYLVASLALAISIAAPAGFDASAEPARKAEKPERKARPAAAAPKRASQPLSEAAKFVAGIQSGRFDVPRVELAARLKAGGFQDSDEFRQMREQAARELAGRPDGVGSVRPEELTRADGAIAREVEALERGAAPLTLDEAARQSGRPQIPGLNVVYLHPLGRPTDANKWRHIIAHQTEGPAGAAHSSAKAQFANPTKRGVMLWVETDGTVYWATAENAITTHGDNANRNDNKYIDNSKTYRKVVKTNSVGVEFVGNYPDVARPVTAEQARVWLVLVRFLQERYGIPSEHVYAHNWIDYKDHRYCEGCELGTLARKQAYEPGRTAAKD